MLHLDTERINILYNVVEKFSNQAGGPKLSVSPKIFTKVVGMKLLPFYEYAYLPFYGLSWEEAKKCLQQYIKGVARALMELDKFGLRHNDVRADNVCFDKNHTPILIDFDRRSVTGGITADKYFSGSQYSCMYNIREPNFMFNRLLKIHRYVAARVANSLDFKRRHNRLSQQKVD